MPVEERLLANQTGADEPARGEREGHGEREQRVAGGQGVPVGQRPKLALTLLLERHRRAPPLPHPDLLARLIHDPL